jgi:ABC-2 type transport system permease protein
MILSTLCVMLLLSSAVTALGSLFLAKDLDLILAAPISRTQFVLGKCSEVAFASIWMLVVFAFPTLWAFGSFYEASVLYYLLSPVVCSSLLALPIVLAVLFALTFGSLISPTRGRDLCLVLFLITLLGFLYFLGTPAELTHVTEPTKELEKFSRASQMTQISWMPTLPCARSLVALLSGSYSKALVFTVGALLGASLIFVVTVLSFHFCYEQAYTRAQNHRSRVKINSRLSQVIARYLLPLASPPSRGIITKEFKLFSRDLSHTIQLGMLLGICFVYLYNFRALRRPESLAPEFIEWWHAFLLLCNVALSSLVVAAICTRFVFPSVSLEGSSFWILQSAPISIKGVLKTKFKGWFIPLSLIGSVIFISGALALNAEGPLVLATCIGGVILTYGLVGLSIGIGAVFSQFDWEYSAQITTTVGSFTLMFASTVLLALDIIPLGFMFVSHLLLPGQPAGHNWIAILSCLLGLFLINKLVASIALTVGERSLRN